MSAYGEREKSARRILILKDKEKLIQDKLDEDTLEAASNLAALKYASSFQQTITEKELQKLEEASLILQKIELEGDIELNNVQKKIKANKDKIKKLDADAIKKGAALVKLETDKSKLLETQKQKALDMFEALARGELIIQEKALETKARNRVAAFKLLEQGVDENLRFEKESEKVLLEDLTKLRTEYYQKQGEMRKAIELSFEVNERKIQLQNAQKSFDDSKKAISELKQLEEESDKEFIARKAEYTKSAATKLAFDINVIESGFRQEDLENQILANDLLNEAELIRLRTKLTLEGKTEKEITAALKKELEEREKLQLNSQIKILEGQLDDPTLTPEEKSAIRAKIVKAKAEIDAVGLEIADGKTMAQLMGISDQTFGRMKQLSDKTKQLVQDAVQERIDALQKEVDFREKMVTEKQTNLETEMKLNELGKASNIKLAQEELAAEKELRDKALKDQKEAARVQFAIITWFNASWFWCCYCNRAFSTYDCGIYCSQSTGGKCLWIRRRWVHW